jgi:hypothetical protein
MLLVVVWLRDFVHTTPGTVAIDVKGIRGETGYNVFCAAHGLER